MPEERCEYHECEASKEIIEQPYLYKGKWRLSQGVEEPPYEIIFCPWCGERLDTRKVITIG